jgi:formimidoylglutamate deiminase
MYTQPGSASSLWFATALLPEGWADCVRIGVASGRIVSVDMNVAARAQDESHAIGIAGVGNVHSHAFQRAMAGLTEHHRGADDFWSWREAMYALVARLTPSQLEAIAALAFVEMLEAGVTRVGEFHYIHQSQDGSAYANPAELADRLIAAARTSGIGLTLLPTFYAHGGIGGQPPTAAQRRFVTTLDSYVRLFETVHRSIGGLDFANVGIAAHSLRAVTPEELLVLSHIEHGGPMHIHIAEQIAEVEQWQQFAGARPVEWLLDHVDVNERWCLVHATHVSNDEVARIATSGATVGLCPITEANLGDGIFPVRELIERGGHFGIGTDSNVLIDAAEELRLLEYGQRLVTRSRNVARSQERSTGRSLYMHATSGGARSLKHDTGQLAPGFIADIVALSDTPVSMARRRGDALLDSWIFAGAAAVDCVWSAGKKVVMNGRHVEHERVAREFLGALQALAE